MRHVGAVGFASLAAAAVPTIAACMYFVVLGAGLREVILIAMWVFAVAVAHVLVLGLPGYAILRHLEQLRWWSLLALGFVAGSVPFGVFAWPLLQAHPGSSSVEDGTLTMMDGIPTAAGWLQYGKSVAWFGALGVAGALAFWFAHEQLVRSNKSLERTRGR